MARYSMFAADSAGAGVTGLSPTVDTWRRSDTGGVPTAGSPTVSELDATSAPGWYYVDVTTAEDLVTTIDFGATVNSVRGPSGGFTGSRRVSFELRPEDYQITKARAAALDAVTESRLSELDPANLPTDIAGVAAASAASVLGATITGGTTQGALERVIAELTAARLSELDASGLPAGVAGVPVAVWGEVPDTPPAGSYGEYLEFRIDEAFGVAVMEASMQVAAAAVWDKLAADHVIDGSFGLLVQIVAGLCGYRTRVNPTAFDGDLPTAITITLHADDADVETGANPIATVSVANTYTASNLDLSKSKEP